MINATNFAIPDISLMRELHFPFGLSIENTSQALRQLATEIDAGVVMVSSVQTGQRAGADEFASPYLYIEFNTGNRSSNMAGSDTPEDHQTQWPAKATPEAINDQLRSTGGWHTKYALQQRFGLTDEDKHSDGIAEFEALLGKMVEDGKLQERDGSYMALPE